jgi:hypothetical protein
MVSLASNNTFHQTQSMESLLLSYIADAMPGRIPGCDGMTTRQMLRGYADLATKGLVPGVQQLRRWHPEFQTQLSGFFN